MSHKKNKKLSRMKSPLKKSLFDIDNELEKALKYHESGQLQKAEEIYKKILAINPNHSDSLHFTGVLAYQRGKNDAGVNLITQAIKNNPEIPGYHNSLGNIFKAQGKIEAAVSSYKKAVQLKPDYAEAYSNLGNVLKDQDEIEDAISSYKKAVELKPDYAEAYSNLGIAYKDQGRLGEAISSYKKALELKPDYAEAYSNLGNAYKDQGKIEDAISSYKKAVQLKPDYAVAHSNILLGLHYNDSADPIQLIAQHKQWAEQHAAPLAATIQPHLNNVSPDRCLRIGYVSPDFRVHSVAYFIEPVLISHDRTAFEVFCYSDVVCPDLTTNRLKGMAICWRDIVGMSDEQVADLIRGDQIDILIDLAGHTANNRMQLFARKPAPVQVTCIGYPDTTGLETIDYRMTDSWADPPGQTDQLYTEKLVRLPHGFLCYRPPDQAPEVTKLPVTETGGIIFGSFNHRAKITPEVVRLWSKILTCLTNSKLILKSKSLSDTETQNLLREMFVENGISPERIRFIGHIPSIIGHLELYNSIDIGLDTFPYNGTTTTCEAMWMGVPVIVQAGHTHVSRVGVSLLSNLGLTELIAESGDAYVEKAITLAGDLNRLKTLRAGLRDIISRSPLTDALQFTQDMEEACRKMWRHWCDHTQTEKVSPAFHNNLASLPDKRRKRISLCMIVKDEERFLPQCLNSVKDYVDEIVIVDTGSTDRTVEIAESYGARVYHHPWENNFSKHRNQSISYATGDWILIIDADEELDTETAPLISKVVNEASTAVISFNVRSYLNDGAYHTEGSSPRLFKNGLDFHYQGYVHNQLILRDKITPSSIGLWHYGYDLPPDQLKAKYQKSLALLKKQISAFPEDLPTRHHLAMTLLASKCYEEAYHEAKLTLDKMETQSVTDPHFAWTYFVAVSALMHLDNFDEAESLCFKALETFDWSIDIYYRLTQIKFKKKEYEKILEYGHEFFSLKEKLQKDISKFQSFQFETVNQDWVIYRATGYAHLYLGSVEKGIDALQKAIDRVHESEIYGLAEEVGGNLIKLKKWDKAIWFLDRLPRAEQKHKEGFIKLGLSYERLERFDEAIELYGQIETTLEDNADIPFKRGLLLLKLNRHDEAAAAFEKSVKRNPDYLEAWINWGLALENQGVKDAAGDKYRAALAIDPDSAKGNLNLGLFYFKQSDYEQAREYLKKCAEDLTGNVYLMLALSRSHLEAGDMESMIGVCEKILRRLNLPTDLLIESISQVAELFVDIAGKLLEEKRFDSFEIALDMIKHLDPESIGGLKRLSQLAFNLNEPVRGANILEIVLAIDPKDPEILSLMQDHIKALET